MPRFQPSVLSLLCLAALAGAPVSLEAQLAQTGLQEVVVLTRDHEFQAPEVVRSGPTWLRLINEGPDFHHIWLVRLEDGRSPEDLMAHLASGHGPMPSWAVDVGGPNTPGRPGEETSVILDLKPGRHVMMDVIPGAEDGLPNITKGMVHTLMVEEGSNTAEMPDADLEMILDDYSFGLSRAITRGRHTIRVENRAAQAHEVVVVRLAEGSSAQEYLHWLGTRNGTEPGKMMGGVTGLARGEYNLITLDFEPGWYALLCFVPDAADGQPHFVHGMVQQFQVI